MVELCLAYFRLTGCLYLQGRPLQGPLRFPVQDEGTSKLKQGRNPNRQRSPRSKTAIVANTAQIL